MKKNNRLYWILGGVAALLLIVSLIQGNTKKNGEKVTMDTVQTRIIRETVSASGKIFPEKEIKISSDVSGEIVELYVKEGDSVRAGQLLARVNPDQYESSVERGDAGVKTSMAQRDGAREQIKQAQAQRLQLLAQLDQAQAQLDQAKATNERNEQLFKEGIIAAAEIETSRANLRQSEANRRAIDANLQSSDANIAQANANAQSADFGVMSSKANLKELSTSLRKTSIYAPANGIISKLNVEKGERVLGTIQMSGTELMRIANMNAMEVQVEVNENDVLRTTVGDEAEIEVDAYLNRKFKGIVTEIANTASNAVSNSGAVNNDQVTNFVVKVRIDAASYADLVRSKGDYPFRPGMSASVEIFTNTINDALSVPIQAVAVRDMNDDKKKDSKKTNKEEAQIKEVVFVHSADTVRMAFVKTGIQDDNFIQITEGLKVGEEIITGPYRTVSRRLKGGKKVIKVAENELSGMDEDADDSADMDDE